MSSQSVSKLLAAAGISALALVTMVGCGSKGSSPSASKVSFNPLISIQVVQGEMKVDGGALPITVRQYGVEDESRTLSASLNDSAEGSTTTASKDGYDYQLSDSCLGSNCGEISMTITRKSAKGTETRAFLFVKTAESKYSQVCSRDGLSQDPNVAVEKLMSECSPDAALNAHDSNSSPKSVSAALSKSDKAPGPVSTSESK